MPSSCRNQCILGHAHPRRAGYGALFSHPVVKKVCPVAIGLLGKGSSLVCSPDRRSLGLVEYSRWFFFFPSLFLFWLCLSYRNRGILFPDAQQRPAITRNVGMAPYFEHLLAIYRTPSLLEIMICKWSEGRKKVLARG